MTGQTQTLRALQRVNSNSSAECKSTAFGNENDFHDITEQQFHRETETEQAGEA